MSLSTTGNQVFIFPPHEIMTVRSHRGITNASSLIGCSCAALSAISPSIQLGFSCLFCILSFLILDGLLLVRIVNCQFLVGFLSLCYWFLGTLSLVDIAHRSVLPLSLRIQLCLIGACLDLRQTARVTSTQFVNYLSAKYRNIWKMTDCDITGHSTEHAVMQSSCCQRHICLIPEGPKSVMVDVYSVHRFTSRPQGHSIDVFCHKQLKNTDTNGCQHLTRMNQHLTYHILKAHFNPTYAHAYTAQNPCLHLWNALRLGPSAT